MNNGRTIEATTTTPQTWREVISLLSGAAAWPVAARAQQATIPIVGLVSGPSFHRADPNLRII